MNIWLVMLLGGLITFGMRFSLIYLLAEGKFEIPETIRKALHYVPPAALSAIIFPKLFLHELWICRWQTRHTYPGLHGRRRRKRARAAATLLSSST